MKKDSVLLTVFTPTYNHEKFIEKCIKNIVNQKTNFKFEMVISDDCSLDNTRDIIKKYQEKYPNIIKPIFRNKNLGPMKNFVETLNSIHTKYVAFCDGDDFWTDTNKLQSQVDFLEQNEDYSICFHRTKIFFENNSCEPTLHPNNIESELTIEDLLNENFMTANTVVYRWKYIEKNSLKREFPRKIVPGDYWIHLMHASLGRIHYINKVMSNYRRQSSGMWYLTSQSDKQDEFYDIYGERYLNFYNNIDKKLSLNINRMLAQKKWIIEQSLKSYVHKKRYLKLKRLYRKEYKKYPNIFENIIMTFSTKEKAYYYFVTSPIKFINKCILYLKNRIYNRK